MSFDPKLTTEGQLEFIVDLLAETGTTLRSVLENLGYMSLAPFGAEKLDRAIASEVIERLQEIRDVEKRADSCGGRY